VILWDTSVVIEVWERGLVTASRSLEETPALSVFSWIELEGGIYKHRSEQDERRRRLDLVLQTMRLVPFDAAIVPIYGEIVAACGYSRRQVFDRLIAATAILHDLTLVTLNGADFADIPDLRLEVWPAQ
jgi:tRNA(fMet)-specific endonuclease VapC